MERLPSTLESQTLLDVVRGLHGPVVVNVTTWNRRMLLHGFTFLEMLRTCDLQHSAIRDVLLSGDFSSHRIVPQIQSDGTWYWSFEYVSTDPQFPAHRVGWFSDALFMTAQRPDHCICTACTQARLH